jgi:hypothetical protein
MPKRQKNKPETTAALDRIAAALERFPAAEATRLGLASIAEFVRELHRRHVGREKAK